MTKRRKQQAVTHSFLVSRPQLLQKQGVRQKSMMLQLKHILNRKILSKAEKKELMQQKINKMAEKKAAAV